LGCLPQSPNRRDKDNGESKEIISHALVPAVMHDVMCLVSVTFWFEKN
jgi:hypothetical protein